MFPTVRQNGIIYFSSNGHIGLGGLDIFKATPRDDKGWIVENIGIPVNSNADDFGITFESAAEKGFLLLTEVKQEVMMLYGLLNFPLTNIF